MGLKEKLKSMFVPKALTLPVDDDKARYREAMEGWEDDFVSVRYVGFGAGPEGVVLNDDLIDTSVLVELTSEEKFSNAYGMLLELRKVHTQTLSELKQEREYSENLRKRCEELAAEVKAQKERYDELASSQSLNEATVRIRYEQGQSLKGVGLPAPILDGTPSAMLVWLGWHSRN